MNRRQSLGGGARGFSPLKGKKLTHLQAGQNNVISYSLALNSIPPSCASASRLQLLLARAMNNKYSKGEVSKKKGFTLAEVLITLGIIGVVAAMTMPTLMSNYRKKQTVTQLQKAYSEINQAVRMAESVHGTLDSWDLTPLDDQERLSNYFAENYLLPNIKTLKRCAPSSEECWVDNVDNNTVMDALVNGNIGFNSFVTPSGYAVYYWLHRRGNGAWFVIDTNGNKAPNMDGIDRFRFIMSWGNARIVPSVAGQCTKKLGFLPAGLACNDRDLTRDDIINATSNLEYPEFACNQTNRGQYCAALIMLDGWEIKDDYPWK